MEIAINWRFIVGIDVSKKHLDIHLVDRKTNHGYEQEVPNTTEGFQQLAEWLARHGAGKSETILISEHTGRYGEHLLRWTTEAGWPHAIVKTTALKKVGYEHERKTDGFDAEKLAEYGQRFEDRLRLAEAPKPALAQIKRLQAERRKMVDQRAALESKLGEADFHDADMERIIEMWTQQVELLRDHIDEIEERITELIGNDEALTQRHQTMRTAPGMGKVLGALWISLFGGQQQLNARKIASRFGFAPKPHSSGTSVKKPDQSAGFGNSEVRKVIHQAALSVKRNYSHYHEYYNQKKAEGKDHLLIINNIINKLIKMYCAMWNRREEYDPDHIRKLKK
ncbi:MAG: IS110 family transposase, partial [Candidatus Halalkalibacterium sp. M3_1C_030]